MSGRNDRVTGWFRLSSAYYLDPKILKVTMGAETLFVRMLALADATNSAGIITAEQAQTLNRGIRNIRQTCAELVDADLLSYVPVVQSQRSGSAATVQQQCSDSAVVVQSQRSGSAPAVQSQRSDSAVVTQDFRINGYNRWRLISTEDGDERPGQGGSGRPQASTNGDRPHARVPPRGKTDRQTDKTKSSPAPPDGLDLVARAAPRLGGAEPRPAPDEDQDQVQDQLRVPVGDDRDDGDSLVGLEHLSGPALAREALRKSIANGSRPVRMPVRLSKYPRDIYPVLPNEATVDGGEAQ